MFDLSFKWVGQLIDMPYTVMVVQLSLGDESAAKHMTNLVTSVDFIGSAMRLFPLLTVEETCCFKISSERSSDGKLN